MAVAVAFRPCSPSGTQRYAANGQKTGSRITVASASNTVWQSNVAMNGAGKFVVSWYSKGAVADFTRVFNADGTAAGAAVQMNQNGVENQTGLAIDDDGNVTLAWTDLHGGSYGTGEVRVCRMMAAGTLLAETLANATTQGVQGSPGLAATGNGIFVAAWQANGPGDDAGIFAQRFGPAAAPLMAAGGSAASGSAAALTDADLKPIVREAVRRWNLTGLTADERKLLRHVQFQIADLEGPPSAWHRGTPSGSTWTRPGTAGSSTSRHGATPSSRRRATRASKGRWTCSQP